MLRTTQGVYAARDICWQGLMAYPKSQAIFSLYKSIWLHSLQAIADNVPLEFILLTHLKL